MIPNVPRGTFQCADNKQVTKPVSNFILLFDLKTAVRTLVLVEASRSLCLIQILGNAPCAPAPTRHFSKGRSPVAIAGFACKILWQSKAPPVTVRGKVSVARKGPSAHKAEKRRP